MITENDDSISFVGLNNYSEVASQINELFPYNRPGDPDEHEGGTDFLYEFWDVMFRIAPQLNYNEELIQRSLL